MASLTALDVIVLLLVGGGAILGLMRGFVSEVISLGAWIAAIFALKFGYAPVSGMLTKMVGTASGASILAFALIFGVVYIAGRLAASAIGGRVRNSILGPFDRGLGLGFGALKGLLVATLGFLLFNLAFDTMFGGDSARPAWMRGSRSYTLLEASSRAIVDFVDERRKRRKAVASVERDNAAST